MYIKRLFFIFILSCCCSVTFASSKIDNIDSTKDSLINVYQKNISTLHYISRKTDNAKMFLTKTWDYTDSLLNLSDDNSWVDSVRSQLELTATTCEENLNHKVQFFPFLIGEIDYLGFADDAIEYAHDKALSKLLLTQFNFGLHFNTVQDLNLSSIIINDNCDDEMFEIIKQTIISNTKHHILSLPDFFIKKNVSEDSLMMSKICDYYGLKRLGIFESSDIDNINNKLFLAKSSFKIFDVETGFTETIYNKGFSYDKRGVWFLNFIWLVLFGVFSITIFSFFEEQILKVFRLRKMIFQTSFSDILYSFWRLLRLVLSSFFLPFFLSLFIVYLFSFLTPSGYDHYLERTSILWMISLTLGMAFIPLLMNLFFINRLDLDGFHSDKGYRVFANTSYCII